MRALLILAVLAGTVITADGQQQERKLIDRLLKPDTSLENSAQKKQFSPRAATVDKKARTKLFHFVRQPSEKRFLTRNFAARRFVTSNSRFDRVQANLTTRSEIVDLNTQHPAPPYPASRAASENDRAVEVSRFPGTRPFLVRGKSQKSLSAQDQPLTIDQVRELLNKNK